MGGLGPWAPCPPKSGPASHVLYPVFFLNSATKIYSGVARGGPLAPSEPLFIRTCLQALVYIPGSMEQMKTMRLAARKLTCWLCDIISS